MNDSLPYLLGKLNRKEQDNTANYCQFKFWLNRGIYFSNISIVKLCHTATSHPNEKTEIIETTLMIYQPISYRVNFS